MQLNHLDLSVPDVALARSFFETAFGFTHLATKGNDGMAILQGDGDFILVLTRVAQTVMCPVEYWSRLAIGWLFHPARHDGRRPGAHRFVRRIRL